GETTVAVGTLIVGKDSALGVRPDGTPSETTVLNGADLRLDGNINVSNESLRLQGTGPTGLAALSSTASTTSWTGDVTLTGDTTVNVSNGQLTLFGAVKEVGAARSLTKVGDGTLVLGGNAANEYSGTTTVNAGTLRLNKS